MKTGDRAVDQSVPDQLNSRRSAGSAVLMLRDDVHAVRVPDHDPDPAGGVTRDDGDGGVARDADRL